jgi:hypothetical protein
MKGFSPDPQNPTVAPAAGVARKGPYAKFASSRLIRDTTVDAQGNSAHGFPYYADGYGLGKPYVYFSTSSAGNDYFWNPAGQANHLANRISDCALLNINPYYNSINAAGTVQYTNPTGFQIISAGQDGQFGPGGQLPATGVGADNLANFQQGRLGSQ